MAQSVSPDLGLASGLSAILAGPGCDRWPDSVGVSHPGGGGLRPDCRGASAGCPRCGSRGAAGVRAVCYLTPGHRGKHLLHRHHHRCDHRPHGSRRLGALPCAGCWPGHACAIWPAATWLCLSLSLQVSGHRLPVRAALVIAVGQVGKLFGIKTGSGSGDFFMEVWQFFFANNTTFRNRVRNLLSTIEPSPRAVLIDLEASARLDIDSIEMLTDLQTELKEEGIELLLANLRAPVRDVLQRSGLIERIGKQHIYLSVEDGVRAFQDGSRQESNREEI